jgi:two-component system, sensor histidine kinase and response regulator
MYLSFKRTDPVKKRTSGQELESKIFKLSQVIKSYEESSEIIEIPQKTDSEKEQRFSNHSLSWEAWLDVRGRLIWMNEYAEKLTGYTSEEYLAAADFLPLLCYPEDLFLIKKKHIQSVRENRNIQFQARILHRDGTHFWAFITCGKIVDSHGEMLGYKTIAHELQQTKMEVQELRKSLSAMQELNKAKTRFLSILSHDLRGPLSGIMELSKLLSDHSTTLSQSEILEMLRIMNKSAQNTYHLLENLLEWSKIQGGCMAFHPTKLKAGKLVRDILTSYDEWMVDKSVMAILEISDEYSVMADNQMLQTIFRNLISNAIKFSRKGGRVHISSEIQEDGVHYSIKDDGIGMQDVLLQDLFKIDCKTNRKGTEGELSNGIGLHLCKEFVERHQGKIWAESEENKGSTFYFTLPFVESHQI